LALAVPNKFVLPEAEPEVFAGDAPGDAEADGDGLVPPFGEVSGMMMS
jgi:hypothetical protein